MHAGGGQAREADQDEGAGAEARGAGLCAGAGRPDPQLCVILLYYGVVLSVVRPGRDRCALPSFSLL